ncbi:ATP-dependent helicase BRM [Chloropicon primus]|uniref:ATP-dependent helicase BRM n=2 Tax=Chloropicon primus TaxID=1764295 RepID=A0A5B8ML23_9CHLO|nr:ATP-dependent helicase BRM [Chloropicon primus]UPR00534.1 ATP-dependent helicase BRM [Chloropicon primus]|eukprot:QDZ21318.1 ATP-dependent helicase BRM [Chloropicon primus]
MPTASGSVGGRGRPTSLPLPTEGGHYHNPAPGYGGVEYYSGPRLAGVGGGQGLGMSGHAAQRQQPRPSTSQQPTPPSWGWGLTDQQLKTLYGQIVAFKCIVKKKAVPQNLANSLHPPPLENRGPIPHAHVLQLHYAAQAAHEAAAARGGRAGPSSRGRGRGKAPKAPKPPKVYKRGPYKKRKKPEDKPEDEFESQLNMLRDLTGEMEPGISEPVASAAKIRVAPDQVRDAAQARPHEAERTTRPYERAPKYYIAGLAGNGKKYVSPSHVYQSKLQSVPTPVVPVSVKKPTLVAYSVGPGNIMGKAAARQVTKGVAGLMSEEAGLKRSSEIRRVLEGLDDVIQKKRKNKCRAAELMPYTIQSKALKLRKLQMKVREKVLAAQLEMQVMKTKEFYKVSRQNAQKNIELAKEEVVKRKELMTARQKDIRKGKQNWLDMVASNQDKIRSNAKRMMQFHANLSADFNKVEKEDRRKKMLRALEEKDAQAYATLVREGLGGAQLADKNELEQLTKFLDDTENYLKDLGDKVKLVKLKAAVDEGDLVMAEKMTRENGEHERAGNKLYGAAHSAVDDMQLPHLLSAPGLRSYQVTGLKWMISLHKNRLNGILADEMGLGKTVQVIALMAWLMEYKRNMGPHLIIVPNAVVPNWRNELKRWFPTATVCVYVGNKEVRNGIFASHISLDATYRSNVVITTYEFTLRDKSKLAKVDWKYVIMDEAHRIKDRTSKLAEAVDKLQSERRLLLTGTPLQNDLAELWSLLNYLLPTVFDDQSKKAFREWFDEHLSSQDEMSEEKLAKRAVVIQRLHQALEPFMLRRQVEDVEQNLPPKVPHTILCALSSIESIAYRWLSQTSCLRDLRGGSYAINNKAMELKKLCNHLVMSYPEAVLDHSMPELIRSSGKMFMLDRILMKMYKSGHRVLLFSTMTKALDILQTYVKWRGWGYHRIDGTTPIEEREEAIQDFNDADRKDGKEPPFIFLLSIRAAGRGLNLQSADTVILYDPDPNPKNEEQAIARSHRIGQVREVRIFHLECVVDMEVPSILKDGEEENMLVDGEDVVVEKQGRGGYKDSVESIIRKEIQKYKIDMANEVIDAGRFDLESSKEEKRKTLQTFLQDHMTTNADNYVIGMREVNRLLARSAEEIHLFDQLDKEEELWSGSMYTSIHDVPSWLQFSKEELQAALPNK